VSGPALVNDRSRKLAARADNRQPHAACS
jgi:hypothetical protein